MPYYGYNGQEIEDPEWDEMQRRPAVMSDATIGRRQERTRGPRGLAQGRPQPIGHPGEAPSWSKGRPANRPPTTEDWERAPKLCGLGWAAWLVGMSPGALSALMNRDPALSQRLRYRVPTGGQWWYFTSRVWAWVAGDLGPDLRLVKREGEAGW